MTFDLTACIVLFKPDLEELSATLTALLKSLQNLGSDKSVKLYLIDNSPVYSLENYEHTILKAIPVEIIYGQGNVGFGSAHNIPLGSAIGQYHLVLNPDVEMAVSALNEALSFMSEHPQCVLLSPAATYPDGRKQYLCKQYPSVFNFLLRGFAPQFVRKIFSKRLYKFEMREQTQDKVYWNPPIVSGCFMFFRGDIFKRIRGFDPSYLLYFEDFDISLRAGKLGKLAYVPSVKIVHAGGHAARKGWWHIQQFAKSAMRFFRSHGVKLF